ncbi:SIMPL domain-containing protein [Candidatus Microgenomates bacterium]|nr:MAG: SIMPL domain-containing protein [Candidatus Microgenomates bacterium]
MALPNETSSNRPSFVFRDENGFRPFQLFVIIFLVLLGYFAYSYFTPKTPRLITTTGVGSKSVTAEKAQITFAATVTSATQDAAFTAGETQMTNILNSVNTYAPSEVKKTTSRVTPQANQVTGAILGYQYVGGAQVTVSGTANIDALLRTLNQQGALVAQVNYIPLNEDTVTSEIRELAITDARKKAEVMAKAAGASLGKVITVTDQTGSQTTTLTQNANTSQPGNFSDTEVSTTVSITFELR